MTRGALAPRGSGAGGEDLAATIFAAACALLLLVAIVRAAWLCEDAFITLRSVDNWVNGYGLRWNVSERVQSYTHPLWMFLVAAAYLPSRDPIVAFLAPSLLMSAVFLVCFVRNARDLWVAGGLILLLGGSKAFVEFSSPGLENPLVHALLAAYLPACQRALRTGSGAWQLSLGLALLAITRADLVWLVGPSYVVGMWSARRELRLARTWLAWSPLAAWELFSLLYYGFLLPNTAYAKLTTQVPFDESVAQGLRYVLGNARHDPVTIATLLLAVALGVARRDRASVAFVLGICTWVAYLVTVGGDFMVGRLLTPALVTAAQVLANTAPLRARSLAPWAGAAVMLSSYWLPRSPLTGVPRQFDAGWLPEHLTDERSLMYPTNGLFRSGNPEGPRSHPWVREVLAARDRGQRVIAYRSVGIAGYYAGPSVHIVDEFALAEPLLAHLPAESGWRAGHFVRHIPPGYLETLRSGDNRIEDPWIAQRYSELSTLIRAPIFDAERIQTLIRWTLSRPTLYPPDYDVRCVPASELARAPGDGASSSEPGVMSTGPQGLALVLDPPRTLQDVSLTLGADDRYLVAFRSGDRVLWQIWLTPEKRRSGWLRTHRVSAPSPLRVDTILIRGRRGDHHYDVGRVELQPVVDVPP